MKTKLIVLLILLAAGQSYGASRSNTAFPVITPATDDYFILTDTNNSGLFGKVTYANIKTGLTAITASGFNGNLAVTDDTPQEVAQKLDDLTFAAALGADDNYVTDAEKTRIGDLELTDSVSFGSVTATGAGGLVAGVASTTQGSLILYSNVNGYGVSFNPAATPTENVTIKMPAGYPAGSNYLWNVDADGTSGWTDPATLGGGYTNLTSFVAQTAWRVFYSNTDGDVTELALGADGTYLKSNGATSAPTWATPAGTGDMVLATAQTVTGKKTFENSDIALLGSSTGATTFASANGGATDYTLTFPAVTATLLAGVPTADNQLLQATGSGTYEWTSTLEGVGAITATSLETTGAIQGNVVFNSYTAAQTLTFADHNSSIVQMTTADEVTMWDCETAGVGATVMLWARDAEKIEVVPASGDHFNLFAGTALTANNELDMAATAGTKVTLLCTADDTWSVYSETSACADGGAAD